MNVLLFPLLVDMFHFVVRSGQNSVWLGVGLYYDRRR